jgi:hydroxyacylglutathione hydrolase
MIFKRYDCFKTGCAAYLFGCGGLGKCAVVDAHVIDTHVHAEDRSGGPALAKKVGAPYCQHASADQGRHEASS